MSWSKGIYEPIKDFSQDNKSYLVQNQDVRGVGEPYAIPATFREASLPVDPNRIYGSVTSLSMAAIPSPIIGKYIQLPDGTVATPALSFASDTDTGIYNSSGVGFSIVVDGVEEAVFNASGLLLTNLTASRVVFAGGGGQLVDDSGLTFDSSNDELTIAGRLNIGTALEATNMGDISAGGASSPRLYYNRSGERLSIWDSGNSEDLRLHMAGDSWYNGSGNFGFGTVTPDRKVEILSTSTQLRLTHTDSTKYGEFAVNSSGDLTISNLDGSIYITPWDGVVEINTTSDISGGPVIFDLINNDSAGGHCQIEISVLDTVGDPKIIFQTESTDRWAIGDDHSDSNKFKISSGSALGTNDRLSITSAGLVTAHQYMNVGTTTDAAAQGEFGTGITSSGRMRFKRRDQAVSDGLASELTAFIDGSGWLRIIGNNADEYLDFTTYQYGHLVSFQNATQQLEFWGYETGKGSVQAVCTMIPNVNYNKFQVRNLPDNDAIEMYFGAGSTGPMITTEVSTFWDLGLLTTRYIRLTSTEFRHISSHTITWTEGTLADSVTITLARASSGVLALTGAYTISNYLRVGSATDATTTGDFAAGITGNARIFYDQSAAALQMFSTDGSDDWTFTARTDGNLRITSQATAPQLQWQEDKAGQEMILLVRNTNTSNTAGGATVEPFVSSSGGDPKFVWAITGGTSWYAGPDNSDSDTFMIGTGTAIGTNAFLKYTTGALLTLIQPTVGNELLRLESTATNDDPSDRYFHGRVATTDGTITTINTVTIPASTTVMIEAVVRARRTGGTAGTAEDAAAYVIYGTYKNVAGTATLVGAVSADYTAEDQAGWDATLAVSGATVLLRVTGAANNSVSWHSTVIVRQVSS